MTDTPAGPSQGSLDRIRKMLAKAEATNFPDEAETYRQQAYALAAKHMLDPDQLAATTEHDPMGQTEITLTNPYARDRVNLLSAIAKSNSCKVLQFSPRSLSSGRALTPDRAVVFGRQSDRERTELLYTSLLLQVTREMVGVRSELGYRAAASQHAAAKRSFFLGFAAEVRDRLAAAVQAAATEAGAGTDLVLVDRTAAAAAYVQELHGKVKTAGRRTYSDEAARAAGREAGRRADLGQDRLRTGTRRAIGA